MNLRHKKQILLVLVLACAVIWYAFYCGISNGATVAFLDVGQGDSIFISLPKGTQVLVDGGPDETVEEKLTNYMPFYDRTIELVVLTHPHADHLRGIIEVMKNYKVERILVTGVSHDSRTYRQFFAEALGAEEAQIFTAEIGDEIWVGETRIGKVLSPLEEQLGFESDDVNQTSVVIEFEIGGKTFLLMGDAETEVEQVLLENGYLRDIDVLKVGHQGSKNATSRELLEVVKPEVAVISVGENNYGHPSDETIARLKDAGAAVLRTDEVGDILWRFE